MAATIELSFTCTFEDFSEGQASIRKPLTSERKKSYEPLIAGVASVILLLGLLTVAGLTQKRLPTGDIVPSLWSEFALQYALWIVVAGVLLAVIAPRSNDHNKQIMRQFAIVVLVCGLFSSATTAWNNTAAGPAPVKPATRDDFVVAFAPWGFFVCGIWWVVFRSIKSLARRAWEGQPNEALPKTLTLSDASLEVVTPVVRSVYQWSGFICYRETKNLFVLQPSRLTFVMIPKRACGSEAELFALRSMLEQHVPNAAPANFGFPIQTR